MCIACGDADQCAFEHGGQERVSLVAGLYGHDRLFRRAAIMRDGKKGTADTRVKVGD